MSRNKRPNPTYFEQKKKVLYAKYCRNIVGSISCLFYNNDDVGLNVHRCRADIIIGDRFILQAHSQSVEIYGHKDLVGFGEMVINTVYSHYSHGSAMKQIHARYSVETLVTLCSIDFPRRSARATRFGK